ncbi:MAG: RagB/SusD family nutrient uptake outer membrane protein [Bacteroidales bacterium]
MKKYNFILAIIITTGLLFVSTSCEDYLERYPRDSVASEEAFATIDDIEGVVTGIYNRMQAGEYNQREMNLAGELLADNMDIAESNAGRMDQHPTNEEGAGFEIWERVYDDINRCNLVLDNIDDVDASESEKNQVKGEAHAIRAHLYFDLLRIYARPYLHQEPYVEGEPLGVILKTEPFQGIDESAFEERATIDEGYQQVLDDLNDAVTFLEGDNDFPYRYNEVSAKAMRARLHLYMGNWGDAIDDAEDVIDEAPIELVNAETGVEYVDKVFASQPGAESILELGFENESDAPSMNYSVAGMATYYEEDTLDVPVVEDKGRPSYRAYGDVILRRDLVENVLEEYEALGDVRGEENATYYQLDKGGQFAAFQAKYHSYAGVANWDDIKVIRLPEMYFIAAEAYAEEGDLPSAEDMLMTLREHRGIGDEEINVADKEEFIELLLTEKRLEYFSEMSHRWFDLRRRGMDIPKGIDGVDAGSPLDFENYRVVEKIPEYELDANENCDQNPGY